MTEPKTERGAGARTPKDIPAIGWRDAAVRTWTESGKDNLSLIAAGVAFYAFLAFVPLLAAFVLTYGLVADPASVSEQIQSLTGLMPMDAARLVAEQLKSMVTTAGTTKGLGLLLALLFSLYGAMQGSWSVMTALNIVDHVKETRSFLRQAWLAILITLGSVGALFVAIVAISALAALEALLPFTSPFVHVLLKILSWAGAGVAVSLIIAVIYRYAPDRPKAKWRWLTPGSAVATLLWLLATLAFGFYVANFGTYNATYGSLGAVIVFLTWLYLSAYVVLMGAELNSELERQAGRDPATARPDPEVTPASAGRTP